MTLRDMTMKLTIKRWSCDRPATFARLLINLELFCQGTNVWVTSKTSWTRRWPEFLRSPKHSSSVGMSSNDLLTSKTWMVKKFQKSRRHNHQYLRVRVGPEVKRSCIESEKEWTKYGTLGYTTGKSRECRDVSKAADKSRRMSDCSYRCIQ